MEENLNMIGVKWHKWAMKLGIKDLNIIGQEFSRTLLEIPQDQNFKYIIQVIKGKDSEANWFGSNPGTSNFLTVWP